MYDTLYQIVSVDVYTLSVVCVLSGWAALILRHVTESTLLALIFMPVIIIGALVGIYTLPAARPRLRVRQGYECHYDRLRRDDRRPDRHADHDAHHVHRERGPLPGPADQQGSRRPDLRGPDHRPLTVPPR